MPAYAKTVAAAIALWIAGATGQASAQVKVGAVLSITGPASFLGDPEKKTLEIYVDDINAKGGVNGQKLQLVAYDDGADANAARTFATRLVEEDKVVAMVGGTTTGATLAMIPLFEEAQIPFISLAGAIQIIEPVRKWVFKTPHIDIRQVVRQNLLPIINTGIAHRLPGIGQVGAGIVRPPMACFVEAVHELAASIKQ